MGKLKFKRGRFNLIEVFKNYGIIFALIILFFILSLSTPAFLTVRNIHNIFDQSVEVGIVASAMTIAIISGNFDLSVGAIFAISGCIAAMVASNGYTSLAPIVGILCGLFFGLMNGLIITGFKANSFIATLATSYIIRGIAMIITGGRLIVVRDPAFALLGQGSFLGIKYPIYLLILWISLTWIILSKTTFGRAVYAIGGNAEAARLSGIQVDKTKIIIFGLNGVSAALAGLITVSRISQGQADIGSMIDLQSISRVVIGGTSIAGGEGAVWRTVIGVFLMRLMTNGFNILNISPFYQRVFEGAVILFAVGLDMLTRSSREK